MNDATSDHLAYDGLYVAFIAAVALLCVIATAGALVQIIREHKEGTHR